jgi:hypothetical protein
MLTLLKNKTTQYKKYIFSLKFVCYLIIFLLTSIFCQTQVIAQKPSKQALNITTQNNLPFFEVNKNAAKDFSRKAPFLGEETPLLAIPKGTPLSNVSFFGIDTSSNVVVAADTNGDRVPDINDIFISSDDPANEITTSLAIGKSSGNIYLGVVATDGAEKQNGQIIITNNAKQDFQATKQSSFSIGKGTAMGLTVINSPKGDILIVAKLFFSNDLFDINTQDNYTITAYLPAENGIPDGRNKITILDAGSIINNQPINFGFGALAVDSKGNLYANVASKFSFAGLTQLTGAILVFTDTNNDSVPDKPNIFVSPTMTDTNPITASSVVPAKDPKGEEQFFVYGINDVFLKSSQIVVYSDNDKDLKTDSPAKIFYTSPSDLQGILGSFGKGSSALTTSRLDYSEGQALFAFNSFDPSGNKIIEAGVASLKDNGTGLPGLPQKIFFAPKTSDNVSTITFVVGVPGSTDKVAPVIKLNNIVSGQKVNGGDPFTLSFNASDNIGVVSINIFLSIDGETFNPVTLGLQGATNSFRFTLPNVATNKAVIRVQALDAAGNIGVIMSESFTIETDILNPTVVVTSPKNKDKLKGGTTFTIMFTSSDNRSVVSHDFQISPDNGENFITFAQGLPGNIQSLTITVPNMKIKQAIVKVIAKDAAGNFGEGLSGVFKIKPSK